MCNDVVSGCYSIRSVSQSWFYSITEERQKNPERWRYSGFFLFAIYWIELESNFCIYLSHLNIWMVIMILHFLKKI